MILLKKYLFVFVLLTFLVGSHLGAYSQCPENVDFELGSFQGWRLYTGQVNAQTGINILESGQVPGRHSLYGATATPPGNDYYGAFPQLCPNGSGYSVKLGNESTGANAEGVSYEFTIPANENRFNLTYYYAVVFQGPSHTPAEQPRLQIEVLNVTDGQTIGCSSFSFIASSGLPGFFQSPEFAPGDPLHTPVLCKDWSANSINLDNMAGKTIQIFFKTSDCTLGGHFGYAYVDIGAQCTNSFIGASFCPQDQQINVTAPFGYQQYTWFNSDYTQILGTGPILTLLPAPAPGTVLNVELIPFAGYGCTDTLTTTLVADLVVTANAGPDRDVCAAAPVQIGFPPEPGIVYHWSPAAGLSNPDISNPFASVTAPTVYTLTAQSPGGGCSDIDEVFVNNPLLDTALTVSGNINFCRGTGPNPVLSAMSADSIQWYVNGIAIPGASGYQFTVLQTGDYNAILFSESGCQKSTRIVSVEVNDPPAADFSISNNDQCLPGNLFTFQNGSTVTGGSIAYNWTFGDGSVSQAEHPSHTFSAPGVYTVKLSVRGAGNCISEKILPVNVRPGAFADFMAKNICINLSLPLVNTTRAPGANAITYHWEFGNGDVSNQITPLYSYSNPGTYTIKLSTATPECPQPTTKELQVVVTAPQANTRYPDVPAIINYREQLHARPIGGSALWTPRAFLDDPQAYHPFFTGALQQEYTVALKTFEGCVTTDTVMVKPYKKIQVNVPTVFTPNGDGMNDFLRPVLWGFKQVNYFRVFNRWGKLVYEMKSDLPGWNGKINGHEQGTQTVIWIIEAVDVDGVTHTAKGSVTLIR